MIVKVNQLLKEAGERHQAVLALDVFSMESILWAIEAAQREDYPIILMYYPGMIDSKMFVDISKRAAETATVPVGLIVDHGKDFPTLIDAMKNGLPSVMFDGSANSFEENIAQTKEIVRIARSVDAYLLCDEVYRHLTQKDVWSESVADLYEKGISVSSMSKVFSLAGLRLGWIATHDEAALAAFRSHRDYDLISCGMFDEAVAAIALGHKDKLIARNTGIVRTNLAILDDWVNSSEHFFYTKPQAGTTALVYYDFDIPSYDFCTRMYHETGAFVTPGDCFEQPRSMRIGYASDTGTLKAGLAAITEFAAKLEAK